MQNFAPSITKDLKQVEKQSQDLHGTRVLTETRYIGELKKLGIKQEERQPVECWSRVMGYHRPVTGFNVGKKQEFADRVNFKEPKGE